MYTTAEGLALFVAIFSSARANGDFVGRADKLHKCNHALYPVFGGPYLDVWLRDAFVQYRYALRLVSCRSIKDGDFAGTWPRATGPSQHNCVGIDVPARRYHIHTFFRYREKRLRKHTIQLAGELPDEYHVETAPPRRMLDIWVHTGKR